MPRDRTRPPRHLVDSSQDSLDIVLRGTEAAALDGGEDVALEHHLAHPAIGNFAFPLHSAAARWAPSAHCPRSANARRQSARFFATDFSTPRNRLPSASLVGSGASGGKRPKLIFIGWKERGPASMVSTCPPVICASSAPCAVVGGGGASSPPRRSAAAKRAASSPMAADST